MDSGTEYNRYLWYNTVGGCGTENRENEENTIKRSYPSGAAAHGSRGGENDDVGGVDDPRPTSTASPARALPATTPALNWCADRPSNTASGERPSPHKRARTTHRPYYTGSYYYCVRVYQYA